MLETKHTHDEYAFTEEAVDFLEYLQTAVFVFRWRPVDALGKFVLVIFEIFI